MRLTTHFLPSQTVYEFTETSGNGPQGTIPHYLHCIGGPAGLAQLYLEAGMLHLEGAAQPLLTTSFSTLSSIRMPPQLPLGEGGNEAWKYDREAASRYFDRARALQPGLDVPVLPLEPPHELEMPSMEITQIPSPTASDSVYSRDSLSQPDTGVRRRRKKEEMTLFEEVKNGAVDSSWYLGVPGIIEAAAFVAVISVVGVLGYSWRRTQGS